ncbi:MAG: hypothetical protein JW984_06645 [Deltaproteobacteria bacterium]|uniref:WD40 repeat domain-containing protein n=1 Tax=Candidatus Zymogenus saltonus TaxID=2844893 RepID=A0A9D8KFH3_9DELT|nr:hypothetical protein [Candidatus Zymogenus saltonus]
MKKIIAISAVLLFLPISIFGESGKKASEFNKTIELKIAKQMVDDSSYQKKEPLETKPAISKIDRPIILDTDADFLSEPLPSADPQRYKGWRETAKINVGQSHLSTADLTGDGRYLLAMSEMEATVRVYLANTKKLIGNFKVPGFEYGSFDRGEVVLWPETGGGPTFLVGNEVGLNLFSGLTGDLVTHLDGSPVWHMRWSPDGRILICVLSDISTQTSVLTLFKRVDPNSLKRIETIKFKNRVNGFALSRDNRYMAVTFYPSDLVELIDLHKGGAVWSIPAPTFSRPVDISLDGRKVAVGGQYLILIDAENPSHISTYKDFQNNLHNVRFSPSGDAVAVSSYDGHVRIISTDMGSSNAALIKDLRHAGTSNVYSLVFGGDGAFLISSSGDKTIRFWGK